MEVLDRSYAKSILILLLENNGEAKKSDFSRIATSWKTLSDIISALQHEGYLTISEQIRGRKTFEIKITDKGRAVAQKLKEAEEVSEGTIPIDGEDINIKPTPEVRENSKRLKFLFHFNVMDNHITLEEAEPGKSSHLFDIYIKQNSHGGFVLWCEADDSTTCWHVREALTYPQVQEMMAKYQGKVKICPSCHQENPGAALFCMHCGAKLE